MVVIGNIWRNLMNETVEDFIIWIKKQNPSKMIDQLSYDRCALGLFYKELDIKLDIKISKVYDDLCKSELMYDINQCKNYAAVFKMFKEKGI
jgi:hypothetical protein